MDTLSQTKNGRPLHAALITSFMLFLCVSFPGPLSAKIGGTFTQGNLTYTVLTETGNQGTVSVKGPGFSLTGTLAIPSEVTNNAIKYRVTQIGRFAFYSCRGLTGTLTLPGSLTTIEEEAFMFCSGFTGDLKIPSTVTSIGRNAFSYCKGFNGKLTLPEGLTTISYEAFSGCSGLTGNLTIPSKVTTIGNGAFRNCSGFNGNLTLPEGLTSIGIGAFENCSGFTGGLTIPNKVTTIGMMAFQDCKGFNGSLKLSNSLTSIGDQTFWGCSGFTGDLSIPEGVTAIGINAFTSCSSFNRSLTLPESLTTIGLSAFSACGFTGTLKVPEHVTSISASAFKSCSSLKAVRLPESVTSIGKSAFANCSSMTHLTLPSSLTNMEVNIQNVPTEMTIPKMEDVSVIKSQSVNSIFYLSGELPAYSSTGNTFSASSSKNLYLKPSVYEQYKSSSDGQEWLSKFNVTDKVPVTFPSGRYFVTMCRDFDVDFRLTNDNLPSGVSPLKAYIVSDVDETANAIILQEIKYVPSRLRRNEAGFNGYDEYVGVLLKGTPGYTYYYNIGEDDYTKGKDGQMTLEKALALSGASVPTSSATFVGSNDPTYVTTEETVDGTTYKTYGLKSNEFCRYSQDGYVPYNKAYLRIPATSSPAAKDAVSLIFRDADGTTTSISSASLPKEKYGNDFIYDLRGMRIMYPPKGKVYIQGGRKRLLK
jgi:hypothetical protein